MCSWTEKLDYCSDLSEKSWLYHEMGYCYLTLADFAMANQCGIMAYETAESAANLEWQVNACLLIAQAQGSDRRLRVVAYRSDLKPLF